MSLAPALDIHRARAVASGVVDPEIPVLTVADLGILRDVRAEGRRIVVTITPTYSGCPAMRQIEDDLRSALDDAGFDDVEVMVTHSPTWGSDWITAEGREKLEKFGIAPPVPDGEVLCPRCRSSAPRMLARFGSTACKALVVCRSCGEPFDYFKVF
ncbi:MAG: 1,2-phenylacetyl-CoA epoxidase subunit PaaD [Acidimicrobiia bacterium]